MKNDSTKDDGVFRGEVLVEINDACISAVDDGPWAEIDDSDWSHPVVMTLRAAHNTALNSRGYTEGILNEAAKAIYTLGTQRKAHQEIRDANPEVPVKQPRTKRQKNESEKNKTKITVDTIEETGEERECRLAANEYMTMLLSGRADVQNFRQCLLKGQHLSIEQSLDFLVSPLCRFFEFSQLEEWDVSPFAKSKVEAITALTGAAEAVLPSNVWLNRVQIDRYLKPRVNLNVSMTTRRGVEIERSVEHPTSDYLVLVMGKGHENYISDARYVREVHFPFVSTTGKGYGIRTIEGFRNTILGDVFAISERISRDYGWEPLGAILFLLTGEITHDRGCLIATTKLLRLPSRSTKKEANEAEVSGATSYTLLPWVSQDSLKKLYGVVKKKYKMKIMTTERNVKIFRFVNQKWRLEPGKTWDELNMEWRKQSGEDRTEARNLNRDYGAAKRALFPEHRS